MKHLIVFWIILLFTAPAYALDSKGAVLQLQQTQQCRVGGSYGSALVLREKVELFHALCSGNAYVGTRPANNPTSTWIFKNCGPIKLSQPPEPPKVSIEYLGEQMKKQDEWLSQDYCNLWKPMPISVEGP